ncbi:hypothetical protein M3Y97_00112600 [Aphelenchoides bicaudatus]|nr:hypothetical protein M3Y97_00112600 [Aphelenchoides bicaudatus]
MTEPTLSIQKLGMKLNNREDGLVIANMINYVARLDVLIMSGNTLGIEASEPISEALSKVNSLKRAIFADMFTGRLKTEIPNVLKNISNAIIAGGNQLIQLDLSDNALGPSAIPGIEEFLASRPCYTLEILNLVNCGLGSAGITVANRLIECKANAERDGANFELKEFTAGRNRLEDAGATAMAAAFRQLGTLEQIELPQNGIRVGGIAELARSKYYLYDHRRIGTSQNLKVLNLNDNTFTARGARVMARAIRNIESCLEVVDFGDCLCRAGAIEIIEALADNHSETIQVIDLSGNELTPDQACTIIDICSEMQAIQHLKLGLNCYGSSYESVLNYLPDGVDNVDFVDLGDEDDDQGSYDGSDSEGDEIAMSWLIKSAILCLLFTAIFASNESSKKKKDPRDFTDADIDRLFDEWEENDDEKIPDDEKPDYEKPKPDVNIMELKEKVNNPDDLLRFSKKGQPVMMFVTITDGTNNKPSRQFTDGLSGLWQSNLFNAHIDMQAYVVEDDRILFLFKDGSKAWEGRDYLLKQPQCKEITLEGNSIPGAGSKKKTDEL